MASWLIRIVSSSGKSIGKRGAICSGLHALAHRRFCRWPSRRFFQDTAGPVTGMPLGATTMPANLSSTYVRKVALRASLAGLGRRADRSACHWAVVARYSSPPLRVAALRRNSREIVEADRPSRRPISCMEWPCTRRSAISSRSINERYRPESGFAEGLNIAGGMPPAFRNHLVPTGCDTPASTAASSLLSPAAIPNQNRLCSSRPAAGGRPGDGNGARPDRSDRRFRMPIATSNSLVLRRPFESGLNAAIAVVDQATALRRATLGKGLLQRIQHEARVRCPAHAPAHDAPGIGIDDERDVDEAPPGGDVGEVRQPQRVRPWRVELPVHPVERAGHSRAADGGANLAATHDAL